MILIDWPCNQKVSELNMLQEFLKDSRIEKVLEIGTFFGGTALFWAHMVEPHNGSVYCIEKKFDWDYNPEIIGFANTWNGQMDYKLSGEKQIYRKTPWERYIVELEGDSHSTAFKKRVKDMVEIVDLLFIDGDHSYEGAKEDFYSYGPLVRSGGHIVLHDILDSAYHRECGCYVHDLWKEIKKIYPYWECIDLSDTSDMGIGVMGNI